MEGHKIETRAAIVVASLLMLAAPSRAQERPLRTADPEPLPHGMLAVEVGLDAFDDVAFPLSGLSGDLLRPTLAFRLGLGGIGEFQVSGGLNVLFIDGRRPAPFADKLDVSGEVSHDVEDPVAATKIRVQEETAWFPALGLRVATRLPSAGNASGLGTDTIDFLLWLLAGKTVAGTRLVANGGLGILALPEHGDRQNDVFVYGVAAVRPLGRSWTLSAEVHGREDPSGDPPPGTDDLGQARVGARWARDAVALDGALVVGLRGPDPDVGATIGFTWVGRAFP